jgi:1,4-dihydroxy-2-naphthoyl-CoA synthase
MLKQLMILNSAEQPAAVLSNTLPGACPIIEFRQIQEALDGGLVRSVHAPEELLDAAHALARRFTEHRSPVATALARQMMWRNAAQPDPLEAHRVDSLAMFYTSVGDGKEGVAAFREKRDPEFTGRTTDMPPFYPWQD